MASKLVKYSDVLGGNVDKCAHTMALNEYRVLFNYSSIDVANPKFTQTYFAGSHGDVGGALLFNRSNIALDWMLDQGKLRYLFPGIFSAGYDSVAAATQLPLFDSYSQPSPTTTMNSKFDHSAVPVFYRTFRNITSYHLSVTALSKFLKVSSDTMVKRETVLPILRLREDYINGNISIASARK